MMFPQFNGIFALRANNIYRIVSADYTFWELLYLVAVF